jgi:hypothetical protein
VTTGSVASVEPKPFSKGFRSGVVGPATRALLGALLFLLATRTATYFAWTIEPPLTAAVLGANYWASTVLAILAARERSWANGRISVSVAFVFAPLVTAATFLHLHAFHTGSSGITLIIAWFWIVAYGLYPILLVVLLVRQLRLLGGDPPRILPLPGWVKAILASHAVVLIPVGIAMFASPDRAAAMWPWNVPVLSARVLAAWAISFGVLALHAIRENDLDRTKVMLWGYPALGLLHIIALLRFGDVVQWDEPGAWFYVFFIASTFVLGAFGLTATRRLPRPATAYGSSSGSTRAQNSEN